ncbi:MMPL family transporter [Mycobacterium europaeum]|uniref:MMPL family transporter n=1 Tax=Mycobacterium europaeum TaxID=761804 RepID=UPI0032AF0F46
MNVALSGTRSTEEIGAGLKTRVIRSFGGTNGVVTTGGLMFAFTMAPLGVNGLRPIAQGDNAPGCLRLLIRDRPDGWRTWSRPRR